MTMGFCYKGLVLTQQGSGALGRTARYVRGARAHTRRRCGERPGVGTHALAGVYGECGVRS